MESVTMAHDSWMLFFAVSLAAVLTPGPAMLAILAHALGYGSRATIPVVLGNALGAVLLIGASVAGVSAVLAAIPYGLTFLRVCGAAYLFWLGARAWLAKPTSDAETTWPRTGTGARSFGRGVMIALSNPKALLFFGAVLPPFVDAARPWFPQFGIMALTFALLELAVTASVALLAHAMAPILRRPSLDRAIKRVGGSVMIAAAALVLFAPVHR
jgi:threonine/homoserine/homoserine lactone efflux protein